MNWKRNQRIGAGRRSGAAGAIIALLAGLVPLAGCNTEEALLAFRDASATNLKAGVSALFNGLIDGAFAVFELNSDSSGGSSTTADSTSGG